MRVVYERIKGDRIKKGSVKIAINGNPRRINNFIGLRIENDEYLKWSEKYNKWIDIRYCSFDELCYATPWNNKMKNVKQVIRHIKKHNEIPNGTKFTLYSRWKGYNVYIIK